MGRFKIDEWVYTYDEQGLVYKHQVRGNAGVFYALTGKSEPVNTQYVFKTKKECLKAMKDAGIQKSSLHMATVIKLENKVADLEAKLAESEKKREELDFALEMETTHNKEETEKFYGEIKTLKQQLTEKDAEVQNWKDGTIVVKLGKLEEQLAEKDEKIATLMEAIDARDKQIEALATVLNRECDACKPNQKAITELNNILDTFAIFVNEEKESMVSPDGSGNLSLLEYVENRIDTLKGEK